MSVAPLHHAGGRESVRIIVIRVVLLTLAFLTPGGVAEGPRDLEDNALPLQRLRPRDSRPTPCTGVRGVRREGPGDIHRDRQVVVPAPDAPEALDREQCLQHVLTHILHLRCIGRGELVEDPAVARFELDVPADIDRAAHHDAAVLLGAIRGLLIGLAPLHREPESKLRLPEARGVVGPEQNGGVVVHQGLHEEVRQLVGDLRQVHLFQPRPDRLPDIDQHVNGNQRNIGVERVDGARLVALGILVDLFRAPSSSR